MTDLRRLPRLLGLVASLAVLPVLLATAGSVPLCELLDDACGPAAARAEVPGAHCPLDGAGLPDMPCCVDEAAPHGPSPAAPPADAHAQSKAQAAAVAARPAGLATLPVRALPAARAEAPAASSVPLYTLLSTLLN